MNITVIGAGYVGLVTAVCLAQSNNVVCVDVSINRIDRLKAGDPVIYEPGLKHQMAKAMDAHSLTFTTEFTSVGESDVVFIAVGTPEGPSGHADLTQVETAAAAIADHLNPQRFTVVVNKSTVPVGTAAKVEMIIKGLTEAQFAVVSNPEFLREGSAIWDFENPDRIVVGTDNARAAAVMQELYAPYAIPLVMSAASAELTKYAANAMLATRVAFMNEMSRIAFAVGANVEHVAKAVGKDSRIGPAFLKAGVGFGGSCFPKDINALALFAEAHSLATPLLSNIAASNHVQKSEFADRVLRYTSRLSYPVTIGVLGLAFKPNTDDFRSAPSLDLLTSLGLAWHNIVAYDPKVDTVAYAQELGMPVNYAHSTTDVIQHCDILVIMTEWNEFRSLKDTINASGIKAIFDGRNMFEATDFPQIQYESIGRPTIYPKE